MQFEKLSGKLSLKLKEPPGKYLLDLLMICIFETTRHSKAQYSLS